MRVYAHRGARRMGALVRINAHPTVSVWSIQAERLDLGGELRRANCRGQFEQ